jgi:anti-sigma B factor antagonist
MPADATRLHVEISDDALVATFVDQRIVDEVVINAIGNQLYDLVDRQGHSNIVLNFTNVRFLASAMLAKLFSLRRKVQDAGGALRLCCVDKDLKAVFKFAPKGSFQIFDDEQAAIDSI